MTGRVLVWIDLEMSGTDPATCDILEVALRATDSRLRDLAEPRSWLVKPRREALAELSHVVREMHTRSGLLDELGQGARDSDSVEREVALQLREVAGLGELVHCGYFIELDRRFLRRKMPRVLDALGFRTLDLGCLDEAWDAWNSAGRVARGTDRPHRALEDVDEAISRAVTYSLRVGSSV